MKKKIMLIVPMLHQGGFERVCVATARLLEPFYEVYIVIFSSRDIASDIRGLRVIDLHMGAEDGKLRKIRNVFRRSRKVSSLKKELGVDIAYSFGPTANLVNVFSRSSGKTWCGVRSYMDMGNPRLLKLFCSRSDRKSGRNSSVRRPLLSIILLISERNRKRRLRKRNACPSRTAAV